MPAKQTFEKALKQLEDIVHEFENGELPLEKAMKKFEEGMNLSRLCSRKLDETEQKITILMQGYDDNVTEAPFVSDGG